MGWGEAERCAEKHKKMGGALRYALIGAFELHAMVGESAETIFK